ncbi:MAG: PD-(D/E)XK nuclease family protein [Methanosarcinales archaeon]|jgi:putative RecB family exonuclease|nr:PD-(D/E)XK nuclease family protein [Methanosarcinales archaeon]
MTTYSHSRLSTFEKCPLSYKYKYLDKIKPEIPFTGIEAYMGSTVHESIEYLYRRQKKMPNDDIPLILILDKYETVWNENMSEAIQVVKEGMKKEDYFLQGKKILADYYKKHQPFDKEKTLSMEERIDVNIEGFKIMGFVDRLAVSNVTGNLEIHDYKTSGRLPQIGDLQNDRQLSLYQIGARKKYPEYNENNAEIVYHYLRFNEEFRFHKTEEELSAVKNEIVDLIQTIEFSSWENNFKPHVSKLCQWCEFSTLCPAFQNSVNHPV